MVYRYQYWYIQDSSKYSVWHLTPWSTGVPFWGRNQSNSTYFVPRKGLRSERVETKHIFPELNFSKTRKLRAGGSIHTQAKTVVADLVETFRHADASHRPRCLRIPSSRKNNVGNSSEGVCYPITLVWYVSVTRYYNSVNQPLAASEWKGVENEGDDDWPSRQGDAPSTTAATVSNSAQIEKRWGVGMLNPSPARYRKIHHESCVTCNTYIIPGMDIPGTVYTVLAYIRDGGKTGQYLWLTTAKYHTYWLQDLSYRRACFPSFSIFFSRKFSIVQIFLFFPNMWNLTFLIFWLPKNFTNYDRTPHAILFFIPNFGNSRGKSLRQEKALCESRKPSGRRGQQNLVCTMYVCVYICMYEYFSWEKMTPSYFLRPLPPSPSLPPSLPRATRTTQIQCCSCALHFITRRVQRLFPSSNSV